MKYILSFCILFTASFCHAQNLVTNPDFSIHSSCPSALDQMNFCTNWATANLGSPDYYDTCSTSPITSVPQNNFGHQDSRSGAYAGLVTYVKKHGFLTDAREYIKTQFTPLILGATYKVTIVVSLADSSFFATDGLGVLFSTREDFLDHSYYPMHQTLQVNYSSYGVINDKVNWVKLTKNFVADSQYKVLILGNFKEDAVLSVSPSSFPASSANLLDSLAYYFIDSVSVEKIADPTFVTDVNSNLTAGFSPNPFTDNSTFHFKYDNYSRYKFEVYDIQGRMVRRIEGIDKGSVNVQRGDLKSGFYYYKLYSADEIVGYGQFIIKD